MNFLSRLCYICLNDRQELQNLTNVDSDNLRLLNKLWFCVHETKEIPLDIPKFICANCYRKLKTAYEFRKMYIHSQAVLRGYVSTLQNYNGTDYSEFCHVLDDFNQYKTKFNREQSDGINLYVKSEMSQMETSFDMKNGNHMMYGPNSGIEDGCAKTHHQHQECVDKSAVAPHPPNHGSLDPTGDLTNSFAFKRFTNDTLMKLSKRTHQCSICDKYFSRKSNLNAHMLIHSGKRPHSCTVCGKSFYRKSQLKIHTLIHTGIRPHQCTICEKKFSQKSNLNAHVLTHTGERSFACSTCGKKFVQKTNLNKHLLSHTSEHTNDPYVMGLLPFLKHT